ncbi:MAG TPA: hypothetical protein VKZ91_10110 [Woeseiaceae bacterium]|nr:hypothetical protein [Woeseiaceae bacterium]
MGHLCFVRFAVICRYLDALIPAFYSCFGTVRRGVLRYGSTLATGRLVSAREEAIRSIFERPAKSVAAAFDAGMAQEDARAFGWAAPPDD